MSGINAGVLHQAHPLTKELIENLEKDVIENRDAYVYLDENAELCFSIPQGVAGIKDLAWDHAYEISSNGTKFVKKAYKKNGLVEFYLEKSWEKHDINGPWVEEGEGELGEPVYYSSLARAVSDTTATGDSDAVNAEVNAYTNTETGRRTLKLQKDINNITETVNIDENLTLDLNGHQITTTITPVIRTTGSDIIIKGVGGGITVNAPAKQKGTVLSAMGGQLTVNGGTYTANTAGAGTSSSQTQVLYAYTDTTLNVNGANVVANDTNNGSVVGVNGAKDSSVLNLTDCNIMATSGTSLENIGVNAKGNATLRNCSVVGAANYTANAAGNAYASNSRGIHSYGQLNLYNCYVWGSHAGITARGSTYVDGGVYEGYGHGAFYLCGSDTTNYFYNATLNWAPMWEGTVSDVVAGTNGAGFYIGGGADNVKAYFDNCEFNTNAGNGEIYKEFIVPLYGIVLRTIDGETNNQVYISNSYVEMATGQMFRGNGTSGHLVYNGVGNDWSKAATIHKGTADSYITTNVSYAKV